MSSTKDSVSAGVSFEPLRWRIQTVSGTALSSVRNMVNQWGFHTLYAPSHAEDDYDAFPLQEDSAFYVWSSGKGWEYLGSGKPYQTLAQWVENIEAIPEVVKMEKITQKEVDAATLLFHKNR